MENLQIDRPLAFIDVETNGLNPYSDRIVELSIFKIDPNSKEEYYSRRVNPGVTIPPEATAVHGITNEDISNEPKFGNYAKSIRDFLKGCDIAGFNVIAFDSPFLEAEFARASVRTSAHSRNKAYLSDKVQFNHALNPEMEAVLFDPQTSGGLIISIHPDHAGELHRSFLEG